MTWPTVSFSTVLVEPVRNGIYKPKEFHGRGWKIVNMGELFAHERLRAIDMKRVELDVDEQRRFGLEVGDLLFARRSLVASGAGKCSVVMDLDAGGTTFESSIIRARPERTRADPSYLFYFFGSPQGREAMRGILRQVAVAGITGTDLMRIEVPLPPLRVQEAIARILGALDDKIELNRRTNETLEAMARAIFQSWFVDFDPVRAKMEGRRPEGMDAETAKLFPSSFDASAPCASPTGWTLRRLGDLTSKIGSGATPRGGDKAYVDEGTSFIRSQNVYDAEFVWAGLARITDEDAHLLRGVEVQREDVLINITGASFLRTCVVDQDVLPARVNQHVAIVRAKPGVAPRLLHLHLLRGETKALLSGMDAGASRQAVTKGHLEAITLVDPPQAVHARFERLVSPFYSRADAVRRESRGLSALRDTLLPRLLSGELRVPDAERVVADAL